MKIENLSPEMQGQITQAFSPDWPQCVFLAFVVGLCAFFVPDATQRKRNRQDLKDRITGKR